MVSYNRSLVLWDVDHTLVDAGGLSSRAYEAAFRRRFGREPAERAPMAGRTDRAIVADTLRRNGIDDSEAELVAFHDALVAVLREDAIPGRRPGRVLAGVREVLRRIAGRDDLVQSVLTGNIRPYAEAKITPHGLDTFLDLDCGAYGWAHTDRSELVAVARAAAGRRHGAGFAATRTVLVGDTPLDVRAALASGARVVAVASGAYPADELRAAGAHAVLPGLADVDRSTAVIAAVAAGDQIR